MPVYIYNMLAQTSNTVATRAGVEIAPDALTVKYVLLERMYLHFPAEDSPGSEPPYYQGHKCFFWEMPQETIDAILEAVTTKEQEG